MLTNKTRTSLAHLLQSISSSTVRLLVLKHLDREIQHVSADELLYIFQDSSAEQIAGLLIELIGDTTSVRFDAPTKYVYESRLNELRARLRADGYEVIEDALVRLLPAAEPVAEIQDFLESALRRSSIDSTGDIQRLLRESHDDLSALPPDLNGGTTKIRVSLESIGRAAAAAVATKRRLTPPPDTWGSSIAFLRVQAVITQQEEDAITKVYTLISGGAHVPKGLSDVQWALLSRTFAVSAAYFVLQQYLAA